ncbi:MAG: HEPN domain-containing protein [Tepidisphaeraceae bacterium]
MNPAAQQWADQARYDLETARAMQASGRFLYVLFCCQQAVEKLLKALIVARTGEFPPRLHSLPRLAEAATVEADSIQKTFLAELSAYYIQTRYPEELDLTSAALSQAGTAEVLKQTEEITSWLLSMLK